LTVIALASVKGAPGVTTLSCLVGAAWPWDRRRVVVECDVAGGDLAARYQLTTRIGWSSLVAAARRSPVPVPVDPHLQQLPGGLDVLVGNDRLPPAGLMAQLVRCLQVLPDGPEPSAHPEPPKRDVIVDLGRLAPGDGCQRVWLDSADSVVLCLRGDVSSAMQVRGRLRADLSPWIDRLSLAVVGSVDYRRDEIEEFTGVPVVAELPADPRAAAITSDGRGRTRRLRRSGIVAGSARLAAALADGHPISVDPQSAAVREVPAGQPDDVGADGSSVREVLT
jgi:hypothetical protein